LVVISAGQLQTLVVTNSTSITLDSGLAGSFQFQWRLNGANIVGATNATYIVPVIVTPTNAAGGGRYSVVVVTQFGSIIRDIAEIVVQPPAPVEDNFANRLALTLPGGFELRSGSNALATRETGEPLPAGKPGTHSVWYKWTAPADGIAEFST